ncbi:MAG TPA: uroporphyrinogen decarboxylase family protein [Candidatus Latescibacteria bacterium]|nr:uroporphyrinogen decarboxylase family protein [Candidatus Latescibacterota bacterium]
MTSKERLLTAYRRGQPDRVPINVRGVPVHDRKWVGSRHPSYRPLIDKVTASGDLVGGFDVATGWLLTDSKDVTFEHINHDLKDWVDHETIAHTPKGDLSTIRRVSKHEYSSLTRSFWVKSETDLERFLSVPRVPPRTDVSGYPAAVAEIGERGVIMVGNSDPIAYVHELLGSELLALWSVERRATIEMLVELFTERLLDWYDYVIGAGVCGVFGFSGAEYIAPPLMGPAYFRDWVTKPMTAICARIHAGGGLVHVHSHGPLNAVLEQFAEMGADVLHPIESPPMGDVPLSDAKRRIGKEVCLEGNIQIGDLYAGEEHEIRDAVKRAFDDAADGGGFVLCPSASPFTPVLPEKAVRNYVVMIETAEECGAY